MPADLDKIRALLASVAGFTPGPWRAVRRMSWWFVRTGAVHVADSVGGSDAPLLAAAPDLHRELTEAVGEIERLRAHSARMVAQINALADACDREESAPPGSFPICDALPPGHWPETATALRRLAAGEVDDG